MDIGRMSMTHRAFEGPHFCKDRSLDALVNACIKSSQSRDALVLCRQYQGDPLPLNRQTLIAVLKACAELHDVETGSKLHEQIVRTRLLKIDPFVSSTLIDMYGKCGLPSKAQDVFDSLQAQDAVTWTALISAYAQQNLGNKALDCFKKMELAGVSPNCFTYTCAFKACGSIGAFERGVELHAEVLRKDLVKASPFVGGALVDMYAKCHVLTKAQEVFDLLPVRGVITWTSLIAGYAQLDLGEEALEWFDRMESEGVKPNAITWASTLKACGSIGAFKKGIDIHVEISKLGLLKADLVLGNALIDMYVKCGMFKEAQYVFDELPVRDNISWNALIAGCVQHEYGEVAIEFLKQMLGEGVHPNAFTFSSSLKACGSVGAAAMGIELHTEIVRRDLENEDLVLGNALVDMYAKCGLLAKAEDVFVELLGHDTCSWNSLVTGHAQLGDTDAVFWSLYLMREDGSQPDHVTLVDVLYACGHAGMFDKALTYSIFFVENDGLTPTLQHLTCMVDLLGRAGQTETAIAMIKNMPFHPNKVLWNSVLSAYRKWGDVKLGLKACEQMWELGEEDAAALVSMSNMYEACRRT
ncbi:hypothetical protein GOP47_0016181 [Adiantum capillus-veneris]|uniref:Pentatricopeptide repeat-containing protein n=1 Tax=Adiantum capillus-veneris TaxID=13818 RepID=A0A9D4ZDY2_ADICA|nr:hypothetical protein GOP47_0016181 [Adiantum capillus-veneris]